MNHDVSETAGEIMGFLGRIMGVGGGAIAGTIVAISVGATSWVVVFAMCISSVLGGIVPLLGFYAGLGALLGAMLGILASMLLKLDAEVAWGIFVPSGVVIACVLSFLLKCARQTELNTHAPLDVQTQGRVLESIKTPESRWQRLVQGSLILLAGPVSGAIVGFILAGPLGIASSFFWACIVLGIVIGIALFFGFAVSAICKKK